MKKILFLIFANIARCYGQDSTHTEVGVQWLIPTDKAPKSKASNSAPIGEVGKINGNFGMNIFVVIPTGEFKPVVAYRLSVSQDRMETLLLGGVSYHGIALNLGWGGFLRRVTGAKKSIHGLSSDYQYGDSYAVNLFISRRINRTRIRLDGRVTKDSETSGVVHYVHASVSGTALGYPEFFVGVHSQYIWGTGPLLEYIPIRGNDVFGLSYIFPKKTEENIYKRSEGFFVYYLHFFR